MRCETDTLSFCDSLHADYGKTSTATEVNVCYLFETVHFPTCFWQSNDFVAKSYLQSLAAAMGRD